MGCKKDYIKERQNYLIHLMDEVVHLQLSKEEYHIPVPKNVPKNIALAQKPDVKQSTNTVRTRFFV